jgi:hypothetical protein
VKYAELSRFAQQLATALACVAESTVHSMDCRVEVSGARDTERCQLCADLTSADELLAKIDWGE